MFRILVIPGIMVGMDLSEDYRMQSIVGRIKVWTMPFSRTFR